MGPTVAGKSNLLHIMSALYLPTEGELEIMGEKVTRKVAEKARLSVGFLFQDPDDQVFMPRVWDDVAFGPNNLKLSADEVKRRVEEAMEAARIKGYEDRAPHHLSFGEKKRVGHRRRSGNASAHMLLDEPDRPTSIARGGETW